MKISHKLICGLSIIAMLTIAIGLVSINRLSHISKNWYIANDIGITLSKLGDEIIISVLKARSSEKDFLLHYKATGLAKAKEKYINTNYNDSIAAIEEKLRKIIEIRLSNNLHHEKEMSESALILLKQYQTGVFNLVQLISNIGYANEGLIGQFRESSHRFEAEITGGVKQVPLKIEHPNLFASLLMCRRHEKDFLLRKNDKYIELFDQAINNLKKFVMTSKFLDSKKSELFALTDDYSTKFHLVADQTKKIASVLNKLSQEARKIEDIAFNIEIKGNKLQDKYITTADELADQTIAAVKIFLIVVILLMGAIVFIITRMITTPINTLRDAAAEIGKGNLDITVEYRSRDEIGELFTSFNRMAEDLKNTTTSINKLNREIEERKQAEGALQESEKKYRLLLKNLPSVVYKGYKNWSIEFIDTKIELLTGYDVDEFNSKKMKWSDIIVEEDIETAKKHFIKALKADKSYVREYRIRSKPEDIRWIQERGQIVCDHMGEIESVSGVFFDVTESKKIQEKLLQVQKLEAVGILAGGIAHDFNNLLYTILGNIELAEYDIKPEVEVSDFLTEALKAVLRAKELTKRLITFSKGGAPVKSCGSIGDLVKKSTHSIMSGSNVEIEFSIPYDLWPVEFDKDQMKHAINNMIANAVESMPDGGRIEVKAYNFIVNSKSFEHGLSLPEGKYAKISIRDQGIGIPAEHLSMIFNPYFSTKEMGKQKGMGLGLAITYSVINRHDGHIAVESEVGGGTTFTIYLPAHENRKSGQQTNGQTHASM